MEYLRGFGNDTLDRVKLIVATHWHDDHIRGLTTVLRLGLSAEFSCSAALDTENFRTLVGLADENIPQHSGVDEFAAIFRLLLERRNARMARALIAPMLAIANRRLLRKTGDCAFPLSITAISPSDGTVKSAFRDIAAWLPRAGDPQQRIVNRPPNHTSVVLWIEAGNKRALLGADLEHTQGTGDGWNAILSTSQDRTPAAIFKVPHHGSSNADCEEVWRQLLTPEPIAVVTPFSGSGLPRDTDLRRLRARTPELFCTAMGAGKPPQRDSTVERQIRQLVKTRRVIEGRPGHVRVRWSVTDDKALPVIELFNGAYRVPAGV